MILELTQFLFDNYKKDNFIDLAEDKLIELLPAYDVDRDFTLKLLSILKNETVILSNDYNINLLLHVVCKGDTPIYLTPTEERIIEILAQNKGHIVTYREIITDVWKYADDNTILKVNMCNLKKKIDIPIITIKGVGYLLE